MEVEQAKWALGLLQEPTNIGAGAISCQIATDDINSTCWQFRTSSAIVAKWQQIKPGSLPVQSILVDSVLVAQSVAGNAGRVIFILDAANKTGGRTQKQYWKQQTFQKTS